MTVTTPSRAWSPVPGGRDAGCSAGSPPGCAARPFPHVPGVTHRFVLVRGIRLHVAEAGGGDPVLLLGHDWGARAAFRAAVQAPGRVSHLLAVNAAHPWPARRRQLPQLCRSWRTAFWEYPRIGQLVLGNWPGLTRFLLLHGAGGAGVWRYEEVEEFVTASRQPGSARAGKALHWQFVLRDIPGMILRRYSRVKLTVPTVMLAGAEDWMLPPDLLAGAGRHADDLQLRVVPGAGHFLADECPGVVAGAAGELFRRS